MKKAFAGFTLVETMVAIAILTVAVAAPLLTAERAAAAAYAARDQLTASYLAEEGLEYVRAMRDDTYLCDFESNPGDANLSSDAWNDFLNGTTGSSCGGGLYPSSIKACRGGASCTLDPTKGMGTGSGDSINTCSGTCGPLYLSSGGIYTEQASGNTITPFTRTITVSDDSGPKDSKGNPLGETVTVKIVWQTDNLSYSTVINDTLTPWQ